MSKRMKVLVAVLVATLLLTVGSAAMVMAQEEPTPTPEPSTNGLVARVAQILEIPQEDLTNAFKQAQQEMREEAFIRSLDKAVEKGRITPEEADEIKEWCEQRPEVLDSGLFLRSFGFPALRSGHMWGGHMWGGYRGWCSDNTT